MIEDFLINNINQLTIGTFSVAFLILVWKYFTTREREKDIYIKQIIAENQETLQKNTEKFTEVINHSQTKMTNALEKLSSSIESEKEVFKEVLKELIRNQK